MWKLISQDLYDVQFAINYISAYLLAVGNRIRPDMSCAGKKIPYVSSIICRTSEDLQCRIRSSPGVDKWDIGFRWTQHLERATIKIIHVMYLETQIVLGWVVVCILYGVLLKYTDTHSGDRYLIRNIPNKQKHKDVVFVLWGVHSAAKLVTALPKRTI